LTPLRVATDHARWKAVMTEEEFTDDLVSKLRLEADRYRVATRKSVLYSMVINDDGVVDMGVDTDSGEPIRGRGKGFQQDILVYQQSDRGHTSVVPRLIVEVKLNRVTSHDAIVYSEKAKRIKRIYPFVRFGLLLAGMAVVPARVLRLEDNFDFMLVVNNPPKPHELDGLRSLFHDELRASNNLAEILFHRKRVTSLRKVLKVTF
jgi:hypothetical protein